MVDGGSSEVCWMTSMLLLEPCHTPEIYSLLPLRTFEPSFFDNCDVEGSLSKNGVMNEDDRTGSEVDAEGSEAFDRSIPKLVRDLSRTWIRLHELSY